MPEHAAGRETVVVATRTQNLFFFRRQGVGIEISPDRQWWCLWLCSRTKDVERIACDIVLQGVAEEARASGECQDCGDLNVNGPSFFGFRIPEPYQSVLYSGSVTNDDGTFSFTGTIVY